MSEQSAAAQPGGSPTRQITHREPASEPARPGTGVPDKRGISLAAALGGTLLSVCRTSQTTAG